MERIRKALEQAERQRAQNAGTTPAAEEAPATQVTEREEHETAAQLAADLRHSRTQAIEVPHRVMLDNRLIAAVPDHELRDSYRMLRTRVLQILRQNQWNSLAVTGPTAGCGKTLTAINLAISLAMEVTHTVLLVDLDLRKPSIHEYFGFRPEKGLSDYLQGDMPLYQALFSPPIERLTLLPSREPISNSSEMLRSPKMLALVNEVKHRYPDRIVIYDLPPVLAADDALAFAPYVDAMLMVAAAGSTSRDDLQQALELIKDAKVIGTVLNKARSPKTGYGYLRQRTAATA